MCSLEGSLQVVLTLDLLLDGRDLGFDCIVGIAGINAVLSISPCSWAAVVVISVGSRDELTI